MRVLEPGHTYSLDGLKQDGHQTLKFYQDPKHNYGKSQQGCSNQEVLRCLIDRVLFLDEQCPHKMNDEIVEHLRRALVLHEMRHLDRLIVKNCRVELLPLKLNGHFV